MPSCEKCWSESESFEEYKELVKTSQCTPEEQAGQDALECTKCKRNTIHQHTKTCVICGLKK